jgi:hypothetical protein
MAQRRGGLAINLTLSFPPMWLQEVVSLTGKWRAGARLVKNICGWLQLLETKTHYTLTAITINRVVLLRTYSRVMKLMSGKGL